MNSSQSWLRVLRVALSVALPGVVGPTVPALPTPTPANCFIILNSVLLTCSLMEHMDWLVCNPMHIVMHYSELGH